jgi:ligand-binding SRPBCC domain-containing protein
MAIHTLRREQVLDAAPDDVFAFFADARNLEAITPPLLRFQVVTPGPIDMRVGTFIQYRLRLHGVPLRWDTLIQAWEPPHRFVDVQVRGPYRLWHHTHEVQPAGDGRSLMRDTVRYDVGFGPLGELARRLLVGRDLEAIFDYRAKAVARPSKMSPTPGRSPSESARWLQRTTQSGPTMTIARLVQPRGSK